MHAITCDYLNLKKLADNFDYSSSFSVDIRAVGTLSSFGGKEEYFFCSFCDFDFYPIWSKNISR